MEIILKENYPSLGYVGDLVKVRDGYARNFLLPRGIGIEASAKNSKLFKHRMTSINAKRIKLRAEAEALGAKLDGLILEFTLRAGEGGKVFGSIGTRDIESALQAKDVKVDRAQIKIADPLKKAGEYKVTVKLHAEVAIPVTVRIISEAPKKTDDAPKEKRKSRGKGKKEAEEGAESLEAIAENAAATEEAATETEEAAPKKKSRSKAKKEDA